MHFNLVDFIKDNEQSFHKIFDLIPIPLFSKDIKGHYLTCNQAYEKISGKSRSELIGKTVYDLWPNDQADIFFKKDQELFTSSGEQIYEADISTSFGRKCIVQFHKATFANEQGETIGLLGAIFDLTEKKELEEKLQYLSEIDDLTGLLNRRSGIQQLENLLQTSQTLKQTCVVAIMDIDHFKQVNDTFGHQMGDQVLKSIKQLVAKAIRSHDTLLRYGGEEFVLCFPNTGIKQARIIIERIRLLFEQKQFYPDPNNSLQITLSIGFAAYPDNGQTIEQLLHASDAAMYQAKAAGRNCIKQAC